MLSAVGLHQCTVNIAGYKIRYDIVQKSLRIRLQVEFLLDGVCALAEHAAVKTYQWKKLRLLHFIFHGILHPGVNNINLVHLFPRKQIQHSGCNHPCFRKRRLLRSLVNVLINRNSTLLAVGVSHLSDHKQKILSVRSKHLLHHPKDIVVVCSRKALICRNAHNRTFDVSIRDLLTLIQIGMFKIGRKMAHDSCKHGLQSKEVWFRRIQRRFGSIHLR